MKKKLGIHPILGGQHKGRGTHNALLSLGNAYFEIIAPDPSQKNIPKPLWMKVDQVTQPQLWTWSAPNSDLFLLKKIANQNQIPLGEISSGHRTQTDGNILSWNLTEPILENENGILPFFLDWGKTIHPSKTLPQAGEVLEFKAYHPTPEIIQNKLNKLGINLNVDIGESSSLEVIIKTVKGKIVELS